MQPYFLAFRKEELEQSAALAAVKDKAGFVAEENRRQWVLFGMQNRPFGP
jgi:hypothetical protein